MPTPSLTLFIEDYKRASLTGALPGPNTLLRQLDELCEETHPGECSKPSYITDYQRARLAGLPVDLELQVAQFEQAFKAESEPDEDDEPVCDECGMHDCDGECVDYDEDEEGDSCPDCGSEFCYGDCDDVDDEDEDDEDEF